VQFASQGVGAVPLTAVKFRLKFERGTTPFDGLRWVAVQCSGFGFDVLRRESAVQNSGARYRCNTVVAAVNMSEGARRMDWFRNDCRSNGSGGKGCVRYDTHAQDRFCVCRLKGFDN
jgi:hypothetical protein